MYKDNWFKWYYDGNLYSRKQTEKSSLEISLSLELDNARPFKEEFFNSILEIKDQARSILFTGNPVNYAIIRSYLELKIPFKVYIPKFSEINVHHVNNAIKICQRDNINFQILDLDLKHFFNSEASRYFLKSFPVDPKKLPLLKIIEMIDEPVVGCFREPLVLRDKVFNDETANWHLKITEDDLTIPCYFYNTDKFVDFFFYRKELVSSYILSQHMKDLFLTTDQISSVDVKIKEFNDAWSNFSDDLKSSNLITNSDTSYIKDFYDSFIRNKVRHFTPRFIKIN